ncbi:MAG: hypothetical protein ACD_4C00356G0003 [uncultured bacterium (gcode 4)]|uniref:MtN3 and saliva related transmembrane protein n=1 Tax=uncultured bacterium (gcode 4) TaxID=1234023 RepID=K2FWI8_9BACT|nr:MAG: hypothetical protein ACD_4C00356G0003 [uncultured bacterium (gcode 4)]
MSIELIWFIAWILVATSVLPQIIKSWKSKSTKDISINWSVINFFGQILWIIYWFLMNSPSLIVMSSIALLMNFSMIILKLKFG